MQQPHMRVRPVNDLPVHLQNQPQHTVRRRVLGTEVHRKVLDLGHMAVLGASYPSFRSGV